jgi:hypothetical protein
VANLNIENKHLPKHKYSELNISVLINVIITILTYQNIPTFPLTLQLSLIILLIVQYLPDFVIALVLFAFM